MTFEVLNLLLRQSYYHAAAAVVVVTRIHSRWNAAFLLHRPRVSAKRDVLLHTFLSSNCIYNLRLVLRLFFSHEYDFAMYLFIMLSDGRQSF